MPKVGVFAAIVDDKDRILLVKIGYGSCNWTLPGGHLEKNESPYEGVAREVLEETGYIVDVENLISVYSSPEKDDIVLLFKVKAKGQTAWEPNNEITKIDFFRRDSLPSQIHPWNIKRINDVYEMKLSHLHIFGDRENQ